MELNQALEMMEALHSDNERSISNIDGYAEEIATVLWDELIATWEKLENFGHDRKLLIETCERLRSELDEATGVVR